jgi:hypothetical protein
VSLLEKIRWFHFGQPAKVREGAAFRSHHSLERPFTEPAFLMKYTKLIKTVDLGRVPWFGYLSIGLGPRTRLCEAGCRTGGERFSSRGRAGHWAGDEVFPNRTIWSIQAFGRDEMEVVYARGRLFADSHSPGYRHDRPVRRQCSPIGGLRPAATRRSDASTVSSPRISHARPDPLAGQSKYAAQHAPIPEDAPLTSTTRPGISFICLKV